MNKLIFYLFDTNKEFLAVKKLIRLAFLVAVVDSNSNPEGINFPIPGMMML